jgi:pimeloyl-ACP methyl ester carboxylesterase
MIFALRASIVNRKSKNRKSDMDDIIITTPYGKVFAKIAGDPDQPMVLGIHGWSQRNGWHTWKPLMAPLADAGYRVVCVDMPGWGQSTKTVAGPLMGETAVLATLAILDNLNVERAAAIMGKSWGGGVALELALDYPERVSKLILTAPAFQQFSLLSEIKQPVLLAWAADDPIIPIQTADEYMRGLHHCQFVEYKTGGHSAAPKNADDFALKAIKFLKS